MIVTVLLAAARPQPGELKTFGDWTVGCDNGRACQAVALVPAGAERERYLLIVIRRDAAPSAAPTLGFSNDRLPAGRLALRVDGKPMGQVSGTGDLPFNRALASALANGRRASLTDANGREVASASLAGLAAAFLHMDEKQGRLGTRGALRRTGPKPDAAVPAPPPLPRIVQPAPSGKPPRTLSPAAAAKLIGPDNATCEYAQGRVEPRAYRLDAGRSLVLVEHPCGNGAYNVFTSVFVADEAGRAAPARLDAVSGMEPDGANPNVLVNADWDPRQRRLSSFAKGRGLGDCGVSQSYAWDGARFRLVEQAEMGECRGSTDYITIWRAAVVAR